MVLQSKVKGVCYALGCVEDSPLNDEAHSILPDSYNNQHCIDSSSSAETTLVFLSDRLLLGEALFCRTARLLGMGYEYVNANKALHWKEDFWRYGKGAIVVVDFSTVDQFDTNDLASLALSSGKLIAFVEVATHGVCARLLSCGFTSIIDMSVGEEELELIVALAKTGQTFLPNIKGEFHFQAGHFVGNREGVQKLLFVALPEMGMQPPTRAEMDVVIELLKGSPNKEIALQIGKSIATVKMHVLRMCRRYGFSNRLQLVIFLQTIIRERAGNLGVSAA